MPKLNKKNLTIYQTPTPNLGGCRCFLFNKLASFNTPQANYKLNCSQREQFPI